MLAEVARGKVKELQAAKLGRSHLGEVEELRAGKLGKSYLGEVVIVLALMLSEVLRFSGPLCPKQHLKDVRIHKKGESREAAGLSIKPRGTLERTGAGLRQKQPNELL
ncbi:hypothetical protein NDU88_004307 [Pleurodeles waltl]|uniref:Uncharacterized protein n=1 Tax=Pleurodeles waltl TaxID=8319 RepID=A0AAV7RFS6_PLEWA|nr:hypothetical protein NDU88_004307 [Pleurodeles waltl]